MPILLAALVTLDDIANIADPAVRAKAAAAYMAAAQATVDRVQRIRDAAVTEILTQGRSVRNVAAEVGLSPARVQQIKTAATPSGVPSPVSERTSGD